MVSVNVLEICRIPPRDSTHNVSLPLTFFDLLWLRNASTRRLFFYHYPSTLQSLSQTILPRLKHSLSAALSQYPLIAGNITWVADEKIPTLHYIPGDAVSVIIAESTTVDFRRISSREDFSEVNDFYSLLPPLLVSPDLAAVMALQITLFPGNGFCIGCTTSHAVLDGKTTALFMKSWASFCRSGGDTTLPAELTPDYDRKVIVTNWVKLDEAYVAHYMEYEGSNYRNLMRREIISMPDMVIGKFMLTLGDLEKIRFSLKHLNRRISNFTAAVAYTWTCSVRAQEKGDLNNVNLIIPVDCRNRSGAPSSIPGTYFGNCIAPLIVTARMKDLTLETAAKAVMEGFDGKKNENGLLVLGSGGEESWPLKLMDGGYAVGGSPRFDLYEVDFGWGRPMNVQPVWNRSRIFHFQDAVDGKGGIEISMVMGKTEIQTFSSLFTTCLNDGSGPISK